jgi:uncharacterized protein YkwD
MPVSAKPQVVTPTLAAPASNSTVAAQKARQLFLYARQVNKRLLWDSCLADRAVTRARDLVRSNHFGHKDPRTGENRAWDLIASCYSCRYGGENLIKGNSTPKEMHELLMDSPTHRKNITSPKFNRLGVGCYQDICVQLFAGS